jgi:hypothetical protein
MARFGAAAGREQTTRSNLVDQHLFAKMAADNVRPASASSDTEFGAANSSRPDGADSDAGSGRSFCRGPGAG